MSAGWGEACFFFFFFFVVVVRLAQMSNSVSLMWVAVPPQVLQGAVQLGLQHGRRCPNSGPGRTQHALGALDDVVCCHWSLTTGTLA